MKANATLAGQSEVHAASLINDGERCPAASHRDLKCGRKGFAVPDHIPKPFLGHTVQRKFFRRRQPFDGCRAFGMKIHMQVVGTFQVRHEIGNRLHQADVVEDGRVRSPGYLPHILSQVVQFLAEPLDPLGEGLGRVRYRSFQPGNLAAEKGDALNDVVVQVSSDSGPLGFLGVDQPQAETPALGDCPTLRQQDYAHHRPG